MASSSQTPAGNPVMHGNAKIERIDFLRRESSLAKKDCGLQIDAMHHPTGPTRAPRPVKAAVTTP